MCGVVELASRQITLNVSARVPERSHYCFTCPGCQDRVEKPADEHVIGLLAGNGIVNKTPWELADPPRRPARRPRPHRGRPDPLRPAAA
jgi:hypothetical protein